jgi:hypothetical protein
MVSFFGTLIEDADDVAAGARSNHWEGGWGTRFLFPGHRIGRAVTICPLSRAGKM